MQYRVIAVPISAGFLSPNVDGALERLTKEVNGAIAAGWEPTGGIAFVNGRLLQAMIKRR